MKKLSIALFAVMLSYAAGAQVKVNINIDLQPDWGPVGYDHVDYYYMPDIDCYYDVPNHQYVYHKGNSWLRASKLPASYGNYDVYKSYKVVINKPKPYLQDNTYRVKYAGYKGHPAEPIIRDNHDDKYKMARNNHYGRPGNRNDDNHHDNGRHNGDKRHH